QAVDHLIEARSLLQALLADEKYRNETSLSLMHNVTFDLSFQALFVGEPELANGAADTAVATANDDYGKLYPLSNKAHALMLLGRVSEAEACYRKHGATRINDRAWATAILEDFKLLKEAGISHPLMEKMRPVMETAVRTQTAK